MKVETYECEELKSSEAELPASFLSEHDARLQNTRVQKRARHPLSHGALPVFRGAMSDRKP